MMSTPGNLSEYQILVTGAAGFLGRRILRAMLKKDAYIVGLDLAPMPAGFEEQQCGNGALVHRVGDVNSIEDVSRVLKEVKSEGRSCSALFHLSGMTHVGQCKTDPLMAFQANVTQTVQLLEVCRKNGLNRVIFPSTALAYGEDSEHLLKEQHPTCPQTIYASTKLAAENVIQGYSGSFSFSCDIARLSNVYGADASHDTAVSTALRQARLGQAVRLRTFKPVRDFIYYEDVVEGLIRLLLSGQEPGCRVFNLSTGQATSIEQMAKMVCEIAGIEDEPIDLSEGNARKDSRLVLANDELAKRTGWRPVYTLQMGLRAAWKEMIG